MVTLNKYMLDNNDMEVILQIISKLQLSVVR